jgi:2-polyprenyl-6-methoxyphenol hydroxylase-like FAD-dependent oxidoreductase
MATLKILIVGGGIAGNAVAYWLQKQGHDITVIEKLATPKATGLQVDLRGPGAEVIKKMGLMDQVKAKAVKEPGTRIVNKRGKEKAYFPVNDTGEGLQSFTTDYEILRTDICEILYGAVRDKPGVKFIFGVSVEDITQDEFSVEATLTDGQKLKYDLLIGADGQWSRTRRIMLGPNKPDAIKPLRLYGGYFTIPKTAPTADVGTMFFASKKRLFLTRGATPTEEQVYLLCPENMGRLAQVKRGDVAEEKKAIIEVFKDAGWESNRLMAALEVADDWYMDRMGMVKMDTWSSGRVVVLGDAAFCPTALTGMGTTSAVVGCYVLAGELGKYCQKLTPGEKVAQKDIVTALKTYETKLRPFIDNVQKRFSDFDVVKFIPGSKLSIFAVNFALRMVCALKLYALAARLIGDEGGGWKLPEYVY